MCLSFLSFSHKREFVTNNKSLTTNQRKAAKGSRKLSDGMSDISNRGRLLSNSFATMRSKMLLFNFAMALGVNQVI